MIYLINTRRFSLNITNPIIYEFKVENHHNNVDELNDHVFKYIKDQINTNRFIMIRDTIVINSKIKYEGLGFYELTASEKAIEEYKTSMRDKLIDDILN